MHLTATEENTQDIFDFGNVPNVMTIASSYTMRFENLTLKGVASRFEPGLNNRVQLVNLGMGLWPSLVLEPNATVGGGLGCGGGRGVGGSMGGNVGRGGKHAVVMYQWYCLHVHD